MSRHDAARLGDIIEAIDAINAHLTRGNLSPKRASVPIAACDDATSTVNGITVPIGLGSGVELQLFLGSSAGSSALSWDANST